MIKDNQRYFIRLQVVLDGAVIIFSYVVAWYFYLVASGRTEEIGVLPAQIYMTALVFLVPFFLFLYYACNLYATDRITGRRLEGGNILKANLIGGLSFMAILYMINISDISRGMLSLFLVINIILTVIERNLVRLVLVNAWKMGLNQKRIILVGYSRAAEEYIDRIVQNPQWGV